MLLHLCSIQPMILFMTDWYPFSLGPCDSQLGRGKDNIHHNLRKSLKAILGSFPLSNSGSKFSFFRSPLLDAICSALQMIPCREVEHSPPFELFEISSL